jgi:nucleoside-diphosphate-sugar epimerase
MAVKPTILVTGVAGNVGTRLLRHLEDFQVIGADIREPYEHGTVFRFERIDLAEERSCDQLLELVRAYRPEVVVHLAFVVDSPRAGGPGSKFMWQTNVFGTSRVVEAIAEHNRMIGGVEKFVFTSSAAVYGPQPQQPVTEDAPLGAHSLAWAEQQQEADRTIQNRSDELRKCKTYILRSHLYGGEGAQNYELTALRGVPADRGRLGVHMRDRGLKVPLLLPSRGDYLEHKFQFVHADDVARLIAHIVQRRQADAQLTVLNVAGQGEPLSLRQCVEMAGLRVRQLPGLGLCRQAMNLLWDWGASNVPPQALPYLLGSCALDTARLRIFLGEHYRSVIQHTSHDALAESLQFPPDGESSSVVERSR